MIKALLMLIRPVATWTGIAEANRGVLGVLFIFLLPLVATTSALEGYGLAKSGKFLNEPIHLLKHYTVQEAVVFEVLHSALFVAIIFVVAGAVRAFSQTFHRRNDYKQSFTAIAYGFAPLLTLRLLAWLVGLALTLSVLYHGLPCILQPDPPHAIGLFFNGCLTTIVATGLLRLVVVFYWEGRLKGVSQFISDLAARMPS
jgi:hypothetical protein